MAEMAEKEEILKQQSIDYKYLLHYEGFVGSTIMLLKGYFYSIYPDYPKDEPDESYKPENSLLFGSGTEPLDFIYTFKNNGDPSQGIPRHWHYIGLGLTDIHGYARLCKILNRLDLDSNYTRKLHAPELYPPKDDMNGFGFELTFRVRCNSDEEWSKNPPSWPRQVMQKLAYYVFQTKNELNVGDHVGWHSPLDHGNEYSTSIRHILIAPDPQLIEPVATVLGPVRFIQIVGICQQELQAAREWTGRGVLDMLMEREETGGRFLVTDMRRCESIFQIEPKFSATLRARSAQEGSNMVIMSNRLKMCHEKPKWFIDVEKKNKKLPSNGTINRGDMSESNGNETSSEDKPMLEHDEIESTAEAANKKMVANGSDDFGKNMNDMPGKQNDYPERAPSRMTLGSETNFRPENTYSYNIRFYDNIYILFNYESARYLPIMLLGRLAHKRCFTFQSFTGDSAITFIPEGCKEGLAPSQVFVDANMPFGKKVHWLQIFVVNELWKQMYETIGKDFSHQKHHQKTNRDEMMKLPKNYTWPEFKLNMTIVREISDDK